MVKVDILIKMGIVIKLGIVIKRGHHDRRLLYEKIRRRAGLLLLIVIKVDHDKSEHRVRVTCIE